MSKKPRILCSLSLATFILLFSVSCQKGTEQDTSPPAGTVLLESVPEGNFLERGIDAVPQDDWIRIEWTIGKEEDLAGYKIYRRAEDKAAPSLILSLPVERLESESPDTAFWHDKSVDLLVRYFYQLRAFDSSGNLSNLSNTVDYKLLPKLILVSPREDFTEETLIFRFQWGESPEQITNYIIRLLDSDGGLIWISEPILPVGYDTPPMVRYNFDGRAIAPALPPGSYRWRVDAFGSGSRSGSESRWMEFAVK